MPVVVIGMVVALLGVLISGGEGFEDRPSGTNRSRVSGVVDHREFYATEIVELRGGNI